MHTLPLTYVLLDTLLEEKPQGRAERGLREDLREKGCRARKTVIQIGAGRSTSCETALLVLSFFTKALFSQCHQDVRNSHFIICCLVLNIQPRAYLLFVKSDSKEKYETVMSLWNSLTKRKSFLPEVSFIIFSRLKLFFCFRMQRVCLPSHKNTHFNRRRTFIFWSSSRPSQSCNVFILKNRNICISPYCR